MSDEFSNNLTPAELERLAILSEELGEVQQAVGKILRHGYESYNPFADTGLVNRRDLEREIGHVVVAIAMLIDEKDVDQMNVEHSRSQKRQSIQKWLHHQPKI